MFSGIDQVVRGDDRPAQATQAFLAELLGYPTPIYAHAAGGERWGGRLAKRDGAVTPPGAGCARSEPSTVLGLIAVAGPASSANASRPTLLDLRSRAGARAGAR